MNITGLIRKLYPINRSIAGDGFRKSLDVVSEIIPLNILKYPTGQKCFDWKIPKEWNVKDAYVSDINGNRVIDSNKNYLHLVSYSMPFRRRVTLRELKKHLHTKKDLPEAIPYVTSYYNSEWGFCVNQRQYESLQDPQYDVVIDSELKNGYLNIGEYCHVGKSKKEIWLSTYLCHPNLCNDNLSGVAVAVAVMKEILKMRNNYFTYRLLVLPETIGPLVYLSNNKKLIKNIFGGYVLTCVGDRGGLTYKKTIYGDHAIDAMMLRALKDATNAYKVVPYSPIGSDERQYSSPLLKLAFGSLMRSSHTAVKLSDSYNLGSFPEYHTSLDNFDLIHEDCMQEAKNIYLNCLKYLENNRYYKANYIGEPCLSKHGLYISPAMDMESYLATFYFSGYADGTNSLWDIQEISGLSIEKIKQVAESFEKKGLVKIIG